MNPVTNVNQQEIPYKYENAKDIEYKPKNIEENDLSSSGELMNKINEEAENLNPELDNQNLKIFSKYEDLNLEDLQKLLKEKTENIFKLNEQKDENKTRLSTLLKNLNDAIKSNADILYKEGSDPDIVEELMKEVELRKKELKLSKNMNHNCKSQYNTVKSQFDLTEKTSKKNGSEVQINDLKNLNKNLEMQIMKKKDQNVLNKNEIKKMTDGIVYPQQVKSHTDEMNNLSSQKQEYFFKLQNCYKSLQNISQELAHLENLSTKKNNEEKDENLNKKVQFWIDIIKSDIEVSQNELMKKVLNNQTNFMKEYNKNLNNNEDEKKSIDEKAKTKKTTERNLAIKNLSPISKTKNIKVTKSLKNPPPKGVFAKFQYLKSGNRNKLKLGRYNFSSGVEEIKSDNNNKETQKNDLIEKDYEEINEEDYKELLEKKEQYITINSRLENDVKNVARTKNSKYLSFEKIVNDNEKQLQDLKSQNKLLQEEISNLEKVYVLTVEQEKLKQKINSQNRKKKLIEDNNNKNQVSSSAVIKEEINEKINSEDAKDIQNNVNKNNNKVMNKNKSGYIEENNNNTNIENDIAESRKLRLQKIKDKYLGDNNNNKNNNNENEVEEPNENQYENEQQKSENEEYLNNIEKELKSGNLLLEEN